MILLRFVAALVLVAISSLGVPCAAHQSISFPYPITRDVACRINHSNFCPGPCPRRKPRLDMTPNNPSITVQRGGWINIHVLANNHRGGFSRWTLVHVKDMYNKEKHRQNAFLFTCADVGETKCRKQNKIRDCRFDLRNIHLRHLVQIPKVYPDGVYVLGWVWYGGGERWGLFGDYYDCMYIKVQGGAMVEKHRPKFMPGLSHTKAKGKCRATVNRIGVCWREPCPGGGRFTKLQVPYEFSNGKVPAMIPRQRFVNPWRARPRGKYSAYVHAMVIRSSKKPSRIFASSLRNRFPYIFLTLSMRPTVTCEVFGRVKYVTFYVNGRKARTDYHRPYSIAGDWVWWKTKAVHYAPWKFNFNRRSTVITCKAVGYDGLDHMKTMELNTDM